MRTLEQSSAVSLEERELLAGLKQVVQRVFPSAEVLLYGSVAKGTQHKESDYDILILTDDKLPREGRRAVENDILDMELANNVILSTIYHSKEEWALHSNLPFHSEVEKHGIVL